MSNLRNDPQPFNMPSSCSKPEHTYVTQLKTIEERITISNIAIDADLQAYTAGTTNFLGKFWAAQMRGFISQVEVYVSNTAVGAEQITLGFRSFIPRNNQDTLEEFEINIAIPGNSQGWVAANIQQFWNYSPLFVYLKRCGANCSIWFDNLECPDGYISTDVGATWTPQNCRYAIRLVYTGMADTVLNMGGVMNVKRIENPPEVIQQFSGRVSLDSPTDWETIYQDAAHWITEVEVHRESLYIGKSLGGVATIWRLTNGQYWELVFTAPAGEGETRALISFRGWIYAQFNHRIYGSASGNLGTWALSTQVVAPLEFWYTAANHKGNMIHPYTDAAGTNGLRYLDHAGVVTDVPNVPIEIGDHLVSLGDYLYAIDVSGGHNTVYRSLTGISNSDWELVFTAPNASERIEAIGKYKNNLYVMTRITTTGFCRLYKSSAGSLGSFESPTLFSDAMTGSTVQMLEIFGYLYILIISPSVVYRYDGSEIKLLFYSHEYTVWDVREYRGAIYMAAYTAAPSGVVIRSIDYQIVKPKKVYNCRPPASMNVTNAAIIVPFSGVGIGENSNRRCLLIQPQDGSIYWGYDNTVAVANGFLLTQGSILKIKDYAREVWLIRAAGADPVDVRYGDSF